MEFEASHILIASNFNVVFSLSFCHTLAFTYSRFIMDFHWFDVLDFRFRLSFHIIIHNLASISPKLRAKHCLWVCVASILLPLQTLFAILFGSFNITLFIQAITSHRKKQQVTIANSHFTTPLIVHQEDSQHFYKIPVICLKQWAMKWNSSALICWRHFINRHPFFALFVVFSTAPWHKINICISVVIFFFGICYSQP